MESIWNDLCGSYSSTMKFNNYEIGKNSDYLENHNIMVLAYIAMEYEDS